MFKWETEEDRRTFVAPPAPGRPRRPSRWAWLLLLGGLALLGAVALLVLRGRLAERQQAMRRDVVTFVEREERARLFGARDVAPELVAPGVTRSWYSAYLETFVASEDARPVDLAVEDVALEENGVLVTLRLGEQRQMRYYRFTGSDWRRAPIPPAAWGDQQETVALPNGTTVIYRPRDAAFAQVVARDLPALFARLAQWPGELKVEQIEFEPAEFSEPIIRDAGTSIVLNSPLLVLLRGDFNGDTAVRLALAAALFGRAGPTTAAVNPLPGSERFVAAAKRVAAGHWALPAEAQARRVEQWRAQLGEHWTSPFFAPWIGSNPPHIGGVRGGVTAAAPTPDQTNAAALLTADFIYRSAGPEALAAVIRQLWLAETWDEVFLATLDRPTIALEAEVAAAVGADGGPAVETALRLRRLPDEVRLLPFATDAPGRPYVGIPLTDSTMPVQLASGSVETTEDGVPLTCLGPDSTLEIEGDWLEVGYRLRANRITVRDLALPIALELPPPDTVAYLIERYTETSQSRATLIALRADGTTAPIAELATAAYSATPFFVTGGTSPGILFRLELANCDRPLLVLFNPTDGSVTNWLAPAAPGLPGTSWPVQRAAQQDLLLFQASGRPPVRRPDAERVWQYSVLKRGGSLVVQPLGELDPSLQPWGWSAAANRVVVLDIEEVPRVGLVDLVTQAVTRFDLPSGPIGIPSRPSGDGRWLAYLTSSPRRGSTFDVLRALDLASGEDVVLLQVGSGEGLWWATWSANKGDSRLLVPAGRVVNGELQVTRLLIVRPDQPGAFSVVAELAEGERLFGDPVLCPDDRILYTVEQEGTFVTRLHPAGTQPTTVLQAGHPLRPLACAGSASR